MSANTTAAAGRTAAETSPDARAAVSRRWMALVVISLAQLMVALDATVINIALPSAQHALHISDAGRQWVITAYTLAFGGLLLLGGRLADAFGRKRVFLVGLAGFAAASAAGGAAPGFGALLAARAAQGAFAALLAPTALSLLALTFTEPRDRAKAFAVFGAIVGTGGAVGLLAGGVLTQYAAWRWCLLVNVPVAAVAFAAGSAVLPGAAGGAGPARSRLDVPGALLVTAGLVSVVYGFSQAARQGWGSASVAGFLAGGAVLLTLFVLAETRVNAPLLPIRIVLDRNRAGSYLTVALTVIGLYGMFLFLTYYFQVVLRYSPARAGLAFLPMSAAVLVSSTVIARRFLPRVPPRLLIVPGLIVAAAGMATLTRLQVDASYVSHVLPGELLLGLGLGCVFVPAISTATSGVGPRDAGVASAVANTAQQVGASVGTALLNTIAAGSTAAYLAARAHGGAAGLVHGYATASAWAAGILVAAAVVAGFLINVDKPAPAA
jgi:EmrB/QacA subfamily drug resistance transporter